MSIGWISLHRKIRKHWLYEEKRVFSKFEAWLDLLMMANHQDNKFLLGNKLVEVKRGSMITSLRKLCEKWKWSNTKVKTFLEILKTDEMISYKSDTKKTVLTIENYNNYQDDDLKKRHQNDTETSQEHIKSIPKAYQKHTNNNVLITSNNENTDNKENKENKELSDFDKTFIDFENMRKQIKKPMTDRAKKLILSKLDKLATTEQDKIEILNNSIMNSWAGVFELKLEKVSRKKEPDQSWRDEIRNGGKVKDAEVD